MKKTLLFTLLSSYLLASNTVNPFENVLEKEQNWLNEETLVVSASRTTENIKKTPASIAVIDSQTITKMSANNIFDLLRTIAGVDVSQSNVYVDKINIRGIQTWFSEKVLILLDGHSLNMNLLNGGGSDTLKNIPLEIIDRIEIVKGPSSALYGENAFSGLINIITKNPNDIDGSLITTKYGSDSTRTFNFLYGKKYENFDVKTDINIHKSNGLDVYVENDASGKDGYTNPEVDSLNAYFSISHDLGFYFTTNYNDTKDKSKFGVNYILNNEDYSKKESIFSELGYKTQVSRYFDIQAKVYHDRYDVENTWRIGNLFQSDFKTRKYGSEALLTFHNNNLKVVSGVSFEKQEIKDANHEMNHKEIPAFIENQDRTFKAIFSEVLYDVNDKLRFNIGARYDSYNDFGSTFNPRIGSTYEINSYNNLKFLYAKAFRAPTFAELYNTNNNIVVGNSNLEPEKMQSYEITYQNTAIKNTSLDFTVFYNDIKDIIVQNNSSKTYENQAEVETYGFEASLKYDLTRGSYFLVNYSYQDPKNVDNSEKVPDISKHLAYAAFNYRVSKNNNIYVDTKYRSSQERLDSDTRAKVDDSFITNISFLSKNILLKDTSFKFSVNNIFDEKTYDSDSPYDLRVASRNFMAQITYKF